MALRRRIGVSTATTEAARRQLMQPVACWEKVWVVPEKAAPGSTLKVLKWVKTDKTQQFSDDEGDVNEPLAPLPDEPEVVEGDDDVEQEDPAQSVPPEPISRDVSEPVLPKEELPSKVSSPKPHPLSISFQPPLEPADDAMDNTLQSLEDDLNTQVDLDPADLVDLDLAQLGPDGTAFEGAGDLSQIEPEDAILGGEIISTSISDDPFAMDT
ncbi:hypothetical protein BC834DRAFT_947032 [Gloeopeniophorella convolvens]|nr:hypothetical protein BC834DRAFT_947032 [Gloeopeniophorella convolvens]